MECALARVRRVFRAARAKIFGDVIRDENYAVASGSQMSADAGLQDYVLFGRSESLPLMGVVGESSCEKAES